MALHKAQKLSHVHCLNAPCLPANIANGNWSVMKRSMHGEICSWCSQYSTAHACMHVRLHARCTLVGRVVCIRLPVGRTMVSICASKKRCIDQFQLLRTHCTPLWVELALRAALHAQHNIVLLLFRPPTAEAPLVRAKGCINLQTPAVKNCRTPAATQHSAICLPGCCLKWFLLERTESYNVFEMSFASIVSCNKNFQRD